MWHIYWRFFGLTLHTRYARIRLIFTFQTRNIMRKQETTNTGFSLSYSSKQFSTKLYQCLLFACCISILLLSGCRRDDDTVVLVDQEEFSAMDRQIISDYLQNEIDNNASFTLLNPVSTSEIAAFYEYLDRNYQTLIRTDRVLNRDKLNWSIHILKDDEIKNTFITPGGAMYITTGMLKTIQTEHELVNILAHEISYADSDVLINKLKELYDGTVLFEIIAGKNPPELIKMAEGLQNIHYSESEVLDADSYAVDIICDFLYDPHGMRDFLYRVMETGEDLIWLKNRPSSNDRPILVEQSASGCGPGSTFESRYQMFVAKLP